MRVACRVSGSPIWLNGLVYKAAQVTMVELYKTFLRLSFWVGRFDHLPLGVFG